MKVLVVGSGGREHALVYALQKSKKVTEIYTAPGNGGMALSTKPVSIKVDDINTLKEFVIKEKIDWTVVGPELPLTLGLVDKFKANGLKVFGVNQLSAQLEGSKGFAKRLLEKYNIPTAQYEIVDNEQNALDTVEKRSFPVVIKADGLAAGKGVYICQNLEESKKAINEIFVDKKFGTSGNQVVIEDFLDGKEISAFAFSDGETVLPLIYAQDYKKIYENDLGPNTGGMGSYTPVSFMNQDLQQKVYETVLKPTISALKSEGITYQGILYAGLMIDDQENVKVLEFNVRFGDPEAQVILPLLETDIIDIFEAIDTKKLSKIDIKWNNKCAVCVVLASKGYPESYETGYPITGLSNVGSMGDVIVFHAGTKAKEKDIVTSGGRVLNVVALKDNLKEAYDTAYSAIDQIKFQDMVYRKDIAIREIK